MRMAKLVFTAAGIWGFVILLPLYFTFDLVGRQYPPPITHPDLYYGFLGLGIAWQVAFLVIGRDPAGFHPMMIPAIVEKFTFVVSQSVLYWQGRVQLGQLTVAAPDCILGVLFVLSFRAIARNAAGTTRATEAGE
jgi:hypothetical protein